MLRSLLWLPGALLLVSVLADLLITSLHSGEGRLTRTVHRLLYAAVQAVSRRTGRRTVLAWTASVLILGTFLTWMALTWLGWTLIFWSSPGAVVGTETGTPADLRDVAYFVGFTLTTLGLGELRPAGHLWRLLTDVAALNGFFLLTFAITFVSPMAQAQGDRRTLALRIHRAGPTAQAIVTSGWHDHPQGLEGLLDSLRGDLIGVEAQHTNAPYLHRFHDRHPGEDLNRALPALGEALLLIEHGLSSPPPRGLKTVRDSVASLLNTYGEVHTVSPPAPPAPSLAALRAAGLPVRNDADFRTRLAQEADHRRELHGMARQSGWPWSAVAES